MLVHLIASIRDSNTDIPLIKEIVEAIHDQGGVLSHDWVEAAIRRKEHHLDYPNWYPFVESNLEGLKRADVVIVDATHYAFSHGFQVAAALEHNKPTLILSRESLQGKFINGIDSPLISRQTYTDTFILQELVTKFLKQNTVHTQELRLNMLFTKEIQRYLDSTAEETGKSKSEIVRNLIRKASHKESENYE